MDYDKRLRRAEQEIKVLRMKKRMLQDNRNYQGQESKGFSFLFWIIIILVILFILYSLGIVDFSSIVKYFKK